LNHWRSTSAVAQFTCSVCKYDYKLKKNSQIASLFFSEYGVIIITMFIVFLTVYSFGASVDIVCSNVFRTDIFKYIHDYLPIGYLPFWRNCIPAKEVIYRYEFIPIDTLIHMENILQNSIVTNFFLFKEILINPIALQYFLLCQLTSFSKFLEQMILGMVLVGSIGVAAFIAEDVREVVMARNWLDINNNSVRRLLGVIAWWSTSGRSC
jgi:hypothetical protein